MTTQNSQRIIKIAVQMHEQSKQASIHDMAAGLGDALISAGQAAASVAPYLPAAATIGGGIYAANSIKNFAKDHVRNTRKAHLLDSMKTIGEHAAGKHNKSVNMDEIRRRHPELAAAISQHTKAAAYQDHDGGSGTIAPIIGTAAGAAVGASLGAFAGSKLHEKMMEKASPAFRQHVLESNLRQIRADRLASGRKELGRRMVQKAQGASPVNPYPTVGSILRDKASGINLVPRGVRKFVGRAGKGVSNVVGSVAGDPAIDAVQAFVGNSKYRGMMQARDTEGKLKPKKNDPTSAAISPERIEFFRRNNSTAQYGARDYMMPRSLLDPKGFGAIDDFMRVKTRFGAGAGLLGRAFGRGAPKGPESISADKMVSHALKSKRHSFSKAMTQTPKEFAASPLAQAANRRALIKGRSLGAIGLGIAGGFAGSLVSRRKAPQPIVVQNQQAPAPLYR